MSASKSFQPIRLILLSLILVSLNAVNLLKEELFPDPLIVPAGNLFLGLWMVIEALLRSKQQSPAAPASTEALPEPLPELRPPAPKVERDVESRRELAHFLGLLQEKGRLVDFVMEDISQQPDARIGQVARVVHQGCHEVFTKHFSLQKVRSESEGSRVELQPEDLEKVRLAGSVQDAEQLSGTLLHAGWETTEVTLPELSPLSADPKSYLVAPAEVEIKP